MIYEYGEGVYGVDSGYEGPEVALIYIVRDGDRTAVVETAHNAALEPVLSAFDELGIAKDSVDYIFLTHIHLDHAGGAGRFMQAFGSAKLVVHPRGARHMIDPSKLVASATDVYGAEYMRQMYGEILPIPAERVVTPADGDTFQVGSRTIAALDTPGHAKHHLSYYDDKANAVFTGDVFGMSYRGLWKGERQGVIPSTSPTQFDPQAMRASIDRIEAMKPDKLFLTHFGELHDVSKAAESLRRQIDAHIALAEREQGDLDRLRESVARLLEETAATEGWSVAPQDMRNVFTQAIELNAQGLNVWYNETHK